MLKTHLFSENPRVGGKQRTLTRPAPLTDPLLHSVTERSTPRARNWRPREREVAPCREPQQQHPRCPRAQRRATGPPIMPHGGAARRSRAEAARERQRVPPLEFSTHPRALRAAPPLLLPYCSTRSLDRANSSPHFAGTRRR
jgi:hypothetical protein